MISITFVVQTGWIGKKVWNEGEKLTIRLHFYVNITCTPNTFNRDVHATMVRKLLLKKLKHCYWCVFVVCMVFVFVLCTPVAIVVVASFWLGFIIISYILAHLPIPIGLVKKWAIHSLQFDFKYFLNEFCMTFFVAYV